MRKQSAGFLLSALLFTGCATINRFGAPQFEATGVHKEAVTMTENDCLGCHAEGTKGAPIAPRSMLERKNCIACHLKS